MGDPVDYDKLAAEHGGAAVVDYDALAAQHGGKPVGEQAPAAAWSGQSYVDALKNVATGAAKGLGNTVTGLAGIYHAVPGFSSGLDDILGQPGVSAASLDQARGAMTPSNPQQAAGQGVEQVAEFVGLPGPAKVKGAMRAVEALKAGGAAAALANAQGAGGGGTLAAGLTGGLPITEGVAAAGRWAGEQAPALVRAAIKPTVSAMKRVAGASVEGIEAKASQLVNFILENKLTTADQARKIITDSEQELQRVLSTKNAPTDAPTRAMRYLSALENNASKQGLPASDVATIRNAAAQVLQSGLGEDVVTMVPQPHPSLVGPDGKPITVLVPDTTRALRTDVSAQEALERARATSKWDTRKAYGEQKGADKEAGKAVERALRDSVKTAVPEARPILQTQGKAIQAADVLDRSEFRSANRDALSLPGVVMAAGETAQGRPPIMAMAVNWLRNNQLKAGVYADDLSKAIAKEDTGRVISILHKLGVGTTGQLLRPAPAQ